MDADLTDDVLAALLPLLEACMSALRRTCARLGPEERERVTLILELADDLHSAVIDYWAVCVVRGGVAEPADDHFDDDDADDIPF